MDFNLTEKLFEIKEKGRYPLHMPGHKRSEKMARFGNELSLPYEYDITEIEGYDNLHAPEGILLEMGRSAASLYGARNAYPLVNGSTSGIISAIGACAKKGDSIILSRGSHKSVYSAIELYSLKPTYIYPDICNEYSIFASITPKDVEKAFETTPDASVVVITSPTYEGVISDIKAIADVVHSHGALLVLDCAHGAHLAFCENEYFPSAQMKYADFAVVSLHKTLPSLTQTALCLAFTERAAELDGNIRRKLSIFMSSSPSYILLSSIDKCISIVKNHSEELFSEYTEILCAFEEKINSLENLRVLGYGKNKASGGIFALDRGKLNVFCDKLVDFAGNKVTADVLAKFLRLNGFEPEMVSRDYLILMTSVMDEREKLLKVADLLCHFDQWCKREDCDGDQFIYPTPIIIDAPSNVIECDHERVSLDSAVGRISLDYVMCYPPGIPILCPGEMITAEIIDFIASCKDVRVNILCGEEIRVKR